MSIINVADVYKNKAKKNSKSFLKHSTCGSSQISFPSVLYLKSNRRLVSRCMKSFSKRTISLCCWVVRISVSCWFAEYYNGNSKRKKNISYIQGIRSKNDVQEISLYDIFRSLIRKKVLLGVKIFNCRNHSLGTEL